MPTNCNFGIAADILKDCAAPPTAGVEAVAYAFNRSDIDSVTYDQSNPRLVTGITLRTGAKAYKIENFKKEIDAGFDLVTSDTNIDKFNQYVKFEAWGIDSDTVKALDELSDLVIIVERKNKGADGDGAFQIYGLLTGLYKSSDTMRANTASGKRIIELTNQAEEESTVSYHVFFDTDYATTKAAVEALLETAE
jgi:hypothetical protein